MNKELNNLVNLRYDQVVNSLRKLCTEESKNYMRDVSLNASKMYNLNQSSNNVNTQNNEVKSEKEIKETKEEGEEKERENEEEQQEPNEEKGEKNDKGENEDLKEATSRKESSKPISLHKKLTYEDGEEQPQENLDNNNNNNEENMGDKVNENNNQEMKIDDKEENNKNDNNINTNEDNNVNNNAGMNNVSSTVNINMSGIGSMSVLEQEEEARLIKSYKEYLAQAEKTIDALFLMKTKNDFLQMVRDKASEFDEANKTLKIIKKVQDVNKKGRGSLSKSMSVKSDQNSELEYIADDNESSKEKELQEKIFRTYMNAERKKMERFINNEKEGKPIKKSS